MKEETVSYLPFSEKSRIATGSEKSRIATGSEKSRIATGSEKSRIATGTEKSRIATGIHAADGAAASKIIAISTPQDIVEARQKGRIITQEMGCSSTQATLVATAISELARNIILYAEHGEISLARTDNESKIGLLIIAKDNGPGIPNIARAMMNGFSTSGGLGLGLPGLRQIADNFKITSKPAQGVTVEIIIWLLEK